MEQASMRLVKPPVVELTEHLKIETHELPLITVCPKDQFNLSVLNEYGYDTYGLFVSGQYSSQVGNKSFWDIVDEALVYSIDNDVDITLDKSNGTWIRSFYPKHGYCWEVMDYPYSSEITISSKILSSKTGSMIVYLSEKDLRTKFDLHLPSIKGDHISLEQGKEISYFIEVNKLSYFDPSDPSSCKEYGHMEYANCVDNNMKNFFLSWKFICNPPWLSYTNVCKNMTWFKKSRFPILQSKYFYQDYVFRPIIEMENLKEKRACPTPCTVLQSKVRQGATKGSIDAEIRLLFEDYVLYSHNVINYRLVSLKILNLVSIQTCIIKKFSFWKQPNHFISFQ